MNNKNLLQNVQVVANTYKCIRYKNITKSKYNLSWREDGGWIYIYIGTNVDDINSITNKKDKTDMVRLDGAVMNYFKIMLKMLFSNEFYNARSKFDRNSNLNSEP